MFVQIAIPTLMLLSIVNCKIFSDVPDNVQIRKDSDINLMKVLESLAPVSSEEDASIASSVDGIERFRRRVDPSSASSNETTQDIASNVPQVNETNGAKNARASNESIAVSKSPIETSSGREEQSMTKQDDAAPSHDPYHPPTSSVEGNEPVKVHNPLTPQYTPQPPAPPPIQPPAPPPAAPVMVVTQIKQFPQMIHYANDTLHQSRYSMPPKSKVRLTEANGSGEGSGTLKNQGLSADEAAFIAGIHNDNERLAEIPEASPLPGSVGAIENEKEYISGDDQEPSASGEEVIDKVQKSDDDESGSVDSSGDSDSPESVPDDNSNVSGSGKKKSEIEVQSSSGTNFLSGNDEEESSGESDTEEDSLPGNQGAVSDIETIEKKAQATENVKQAPVLVKTTATTKTAAAVGIEKPQANAVVQQASETETTDKEPSLTNAASYKEAADETDSGSGTPAAAEVISHSFGELQNDKSSSGENEASASGQVPLAPPNYRNEEPAEPINPLLSLAKTKDQTEVAESITPAAKLLQSSKPNTVEVQTLSNSAGKNQENTDLSSLLDSESGSGSGSDSDNLFMSDSEEQLPGSVGAMGPNLMTMNSEVEGSGDSKEDSKTFVSGSGLESQETITNSNYKKDNIAAVPATNVTAQPSVTIPEVGSGMDLGFPEVSSSSGEEILPEGVGNNDKDSLQLMTESGEEVTSGAASASDSGSTSEIFGDSVTTSVTKDKPAVIDASSGQGSTESDAGQQTVVTSATPKPAVLSTTSALDAPLKPAIILPESLGVEDSISFSGSGISEASSPSIESSLDETSGEDSTDDHEQLPQYKKTITEETLGSGQEAVAEDHNTAEEGSGTVTTQEATGDSQPSMSFQMPSFNLNKESALKAAIGAAGLHNAALNSALGSGAEIEGSSDALEGSGITGTLEFTPVTNPEEAVLKVAANEAKNDKDSEETEQPEGSAKTHSSGENRHDIPTSGTFEDEPEVETEVEEENEEDDSWPKLGATIDQQILDHFMISQILEQNLTLFYGGLSGKSGTTGPPGPPGDLGQQGLTGEPGPLGTAGDVGAPGADGVPGVKGALGSPGGFGFKGMRGFQGPPGIAGSPGAPGIPGVIGYSGPPGPDAITPNCSYVCEGDRTWLQCKQYEMIKVNRAFWGREDNKICSKAPLGLTVDKPCETDPDLAMKKINSQCQNQGACEIIASNVFFNEPSCKNAYKYLKLCYECLPDTANAVDVLRDYGKRKKRGTKLEHLISTIKAKEEKRVMDELWRHPFKAPTF